MKKELDARMRLMECFHSLRLAPESWVVLRLDGRGFSRFTSSHFEKPFDSNFHALMTAAAECLVEEFSSPYVYTQSDEISVLLKPECDHFDRRIEKILSISASIAAASFSLGCGQQAQFDSRVWASGNPESVCDYFGWRQHDARRCALNGWCYWALRNEGQTAAQATSLLNGARRSEKHELLHQRGLNFAEFPLWQRRGSGLYWESFQRDGFNPLTQETMTATRRRVQVDSQLPRGEEYRRFIAKLVDLE